MNSHERAQAFAKTALALMGERNVPPTPQNFQLFYAYAAGENPAVARVMGDMIAGRKPFTAAILDDLRERFFQTARVEKAVEQVGTGIDSALTSMINTIEAAGRDAKDYGRTLSAASDELTAERSPEDMRRLVEGLVSATQAMEARTKVLEEELQQSSSQVKDLRTQLEDVRRESLTDPLTGIANRKAFDTALAEAVARSREAGEPLSLLMCDIDHFKKFNDTWGHQTGDTVIRLVANCLSENVKGRDTAARYGGEEFAVILPQTALADATRLADHIRGAVHSKKLVKKSTGDVLGVISISVGIAQFNGSEDPSDWVRRADDCLYAAKNAGRNCVIAESDPRAAEQTAAA
ncbi:MAG: diguanylate cyclase [Alphaproteobacteria bacterium]|nr:diguanylate cyclase [Alphaproteobacteria bacterium]